MIYPIVTVQVKVNNVQFDFSGDDDVDENYMIDVEQSYENKIFTVEIDEDPEYFEDFIIEAVTDHLSNVSGWFVDDYDYAIVSVS